MFRREARGLKAVYNNDIYECVNTISHTQKQQSLVLCTNYRRRRCIILGLLLLLLLKFYLCYVNIISIKTGVILTVVQLLASGLVWCWCYYWPSRAAGVAYREKSHNHLLTNDGHLYSSSMEGRHVEQVFMKRATPDNITQIWIKHAPCTQCSARLKQFFDNNKEKPTMHIASVRREQGNDEDEEGLADLSNDGFEVKKWGQLAEMMGGQKSRQELKGPDTSRHIKSPVWCWVTVHGP